MVNWSVTTLLRAVWELERWNRIVGCRILMACYYLDQVDEIWRRQCLRRSHLPRQVAWVCPVDRIAYFLGRLDREGVYRL